jgi:hypothetical protein
MGLFPECQLIRELVSLIHFKITMLGGFFMEIKKNGVLLQEKEMSPSMKPNRCGTCNSKLILQIYNYDKRIIKVVHCKKCETYSSLAPPRPYSTKFNTIEPPKLPTKESKDKKTKNDPMKDILVPKREEKS